MFYTTIENQLRIDGSYGLLYDHFADENPALAESRALAKFHTICAAAAVSEIPYHSACILTSDGRILRQEIFDRRDSIPIVPPEAASVEE